MGAYGWADITRLKERRENSNYVGFGFIDRSAESIPNMLSYLSNTQTGGFRLVTVIAVQCRCIRIPDFALVRHFKSLASERSQVPEFEFLRRNVDFALLSIAFLFAASFSASQAVSATSTGGKARRMIQAHELAARK